MKLFPIFGWIIFLSNPRVRCDKRSSNGIFEKFSLRNWEIYLEPNDLFQGRSVHGGDIIWSSLFSSHFVGVSLKQAIVKEMV